MSLRSQLAYLAAGLTLIIGLLGLINPFLVLRLTGLEMVEPRGLGHARAIFGAMLTTLGGFMLWALSARPRARAVLRLASFLWLASALGRLLSLFIDGPFSFGAAVLFAIDLVIGVGAFLGATEPAPGGRGEEPEDPLRAYRS